jgi:hypothetical protein
MSASDLPAPDWRGLLAIGVDRLRHPGLYAWYFGASVGLAVLAAAGARSGALGMAFTAATSLLNIYVGLLLARQLMLGRLETLPGDAGRVLRVLGVGLLVVPLAIVAVLPVFLLAPSSAGPLIVVAVAVVALACLGYAARIALYLPALALGDAMTLRRSFAQGRPYWGRLSIVFVILAAPTAAASWVIENAGLPWFISAAIEGAFGAVVGMVGLAAPCYLYWTRVRA